MNAAHYAPNRKEAMDKFFSVSYTHVSLQTIVSLVQINVPLVEPLFFCASPRTASFSFHML
jgi:hypothetical protein